MVAKKSTNHDPQWAKARNVCRLNMEDVRRAKALGLSPKTLMKNNPSPSQRWKAPVKYWIRDLYEERFARKPPPISTPVDSQTTDDRATEVIASEESIPF